ncbi:MAG: hypothetical protein J7L14_03580 [Candidatus Diapherotrites archaeon]|nr:hypothetical protein [Candidatus Diapherotrites archaeon]
MDKMRNKILSFFILIFLLTFVDYLALYATFVFITEQTIYGWQKPYELLIAIWLITIASNILFPKWICKKKG